VAGHATRERKRVTNAWLAAGLGLVVTVNVALAWILLGPAIARRLDERAAARRADGHAGGAPEGRAAAPFDGTETMAGGVPAATYDRVVRVASWAYLLSTGAVVYASGLWPGAERTILLVLALGGVFVLLAHDLLPFGRLGAARSLVEGAVALIVVSAVVALTGGALSPFFYGFPLVVVGAALLVPPLVTAVLGLAAVGGYLAAVVAAAGGFTLEHGQIAPLLVNLSALVLLAYVATVVSWEQRRTRDVAVRLSTTDALTGLANRGYMLAAIEREIDRATRYRRGFAVLMVDLDGLKELNDTFGHRTGDRALAAVAAVLRESVRRIDTVARLGGDEFVVLLPETDREGALVVAGKVRQGVADTQIVERGGRIPISVSLGVSEWARGDSLDDVMAEADHAMYQDKHRRRGQQRLGPPALAAMGPGRFGPAAAGRQPAPASGPAPARGPAPEERS
jgi:diguanylate cyclase (GGDEF)-like protein